MRVVHVHCRYREPGGEDAVVAAERRRLLSAGVDVVPVDAQNADEPLRAALQLGAAAWNPRAAAAMRRVVRDSEPDIVHVHNTWFALSHSVLTTAHDAGAPVAMTVHNYRLACVNGQFFRDGHACTDCLDGFIWRSVGRKCYRSSVASSAAAATATATNRRMGTVTRAVDRYLTLNGEQERMLATLGVPPGRIERITNSVADAGLRHSPPSQSRSILYVGRLSVEKGLSVLLEAWRRWRPHEDWELIVVGDGSERHALEGLADGRVRWFGRRPADDVRRLMLSARSLVVPSVWFEGQPMVVLEAFSAALPVLASALGGVGETVAATGRRWTCPPTVAGWADALEAVVADARVDEQSRLVRRAYERTYTPRVATERLLDVYADLASAQ